MHSWVSHKHYKAELKVKDQLEICSKPFRVVSSRVFNDLRKKTQNIMLIKSIGHQEIDSTQNNLGEIQKRPGSIHEFPMSMIEQS